MQCVIYSAAEYVKEKIIKRINDGENLRNLIIDGSAMCSIDMTAVKILTSLVEDCRVIDVKVYFWNWKSETKAAVVRFDEKYRDLFKSGLQFAKIDDVVESLKIPQNGKIDFV